MLKLIAVDDNTNDHMSRGAAMVLVFKLCSENQTRHLSKQNVALLAAAQCLPNPESITRQRRVKSHGAMRYYALDG
jgi:hypothetical protein